MVARFECAREQVVGVAEISGDLAALLQVGDARLHLPEGAQRGAKRREGVALDGPVADLPSDGDRRLAPGLRLRVARLQHEELAVRGHCAGQLWRRRLGGDRGHRRGRLCGWPALTQASSACAEFR
jgi:hypothetical protein